MNSFLFSIDVCETEFAKGVWKKRNISRYAEETIKAKFSS